MREKPEQLLDPDVETREESAPETLLFFFRIGGRAYALPPGVIERVSAVITPVPVPTAPRVVRGIVHLRGRILTVIDLAEVLGIDVSTDLDPRDRRLVVVTVADHAFAFVADAVRGIEPVRQEGVIADASGDRGVIGRVEDGELVAALLDANALLGILRADAAGGAA